MRANRGILASILIGGMAWTGTAHALDPAKPETPQVVVTPVLTTTRTAEDQPITLPTRNAQVIASIFDIPVGASLPIHKHAFPRYAYVLGGTLQVTNAETGKATRYAAGEFVVEMIDKWHQGANAGDVAVKLLVIDQVEEGSLNTLLRK